MPYHEYYQSVFQSTYTKVFLRFLRCNNEFEYKLDTEEIVSELTHYINSTSKRSIFPQEAIYGVNAIKHTLNILIESNNLDEQMVDLFCEFRWSMIER